MVMAAESLRMAPAQGPSPDASAGRSGGRRVLVNRQLPVRQAVAGVQAVSGFCVCGCLGAAEAVRSGPGYMPFRQGNQQEQNPLPPPLPKRR